jgi:hypothetical protein
MEEQVEATFLECDAHHHVSFLPARLSLVLFLLYFSLSIYGDSLALFLLRLAPAAVLAVVEENATGEGSGVIFKKWTGLEEDEKVDGHYGGGVFSCCTSVGQ